MEFGFIFYEKDRKTASGELSLDYLRQKNNRSSVEFSVNPCQKERNKSSCGFWFLFCKKNIRNGRGREFHSTLCKRHAKRVIWKIPFWPT